MASFMSNATSRDDDLDTSFARIRDKLLDGIETTLDRLAQPDRARALRRAAIADAASARVAPLLCVQATCRRAQRCRRDPCTVPQVAVAMADRA